MKVVKTVRPLGIIPLKQQFDIEWPSKGQIKLFLIKKIKEAKSKK